MDSSFNWRRPGWLAVAFAAAAFAVPAAEAQHAPGEDPGTTAPHQSLRGSASALQGNSDTEWSASPLEIDWLGPKRVPLQHPFSAPTTVFKVVSPTGFDWADAAIGAGGASLTIALVAGLALLLTRRSPRTIGPEQSELAGS